MTSTGNSSLGKTDNTYEGHPNMEKIFAEIIKSEDFKRATSSMIHVMLNQWAGESSAKKWIANPLEKGLKKAFIKPVEPGDAGAQGVSKIGDLIEPIAGLMSEILGRMSEFAKSIEELPPEEKAKLIEKISANLNTGQLGNMMSSLSNIVQADQRVGLVPLVNAGAKKLLDIITEFNQNFSEEPNTSSGASSIKLRNIDGVTIGKLLNQCFKTIRKVKKRTEHLRDSSILDTENEWINKVEEIGSELDIGFLMQSRMAIEEYKESFKNWLMS